MEEKFVCLCFFFASAIQALLQSHNAKNPEKKRETPIQAFVFKVFSEVKGLGKGRCRSRRIADAYAEQREKGNESVSGRKKKQENEK